MRRSAKGHSRLTRMLPDGDGTDVVREIKASYPETLVDG